jgi:large subunit ribosomal protein L15
VSPEALSEAGIIKSASKPVVILGRGELDRQLTVKAHRFSASARAKIEAAGGTVEVLPLET